MNLLEGNSILLASGRLGSGKSALQKEIVRLISANSRVKYFDDVVEINFADPLYEIQNDTLKKMLSWGIKHNIVKSRRFLQFLGTDFGRNDFYPDVWLDIAKNKILIHQSQNANKKILYIIGDGRFKNEFDGFENALRVRLVCPEKERMKRAASPSRVRHQSEIDLDLYSELKLFDLYLDTSSKGINVQNCATLVMAQLQKNSFKSKRIQLSDIPKYKIYLAKAKVWLANLL